MTSVVYNVTAVPGTTFRLGGRREPYELFTTVSINDGGGPFEIHAPPTGQLDTIHFVLFNNTNAVDLTVRFANDTVLSLNTPGSVTARWSAGRWHVSQFTFDVLARMDGNVLVNPLVPSIVAFVRGSARGFLLQVSPGPADVERVLSVTNANNAPIAVRLAGQSETQLAEAGLLNAVWNGATWAFQLRPPSKNNASQ